MADEIEHKYLVRGTYKRFATSVSHIVQGYLCSEPSRTVRVRITNKQAYLTIKGPSSKDGLQRYEFEKEIELAEAEQLMKLCELGVIEKNRYFIPLEHHVCEVDEFLGENEGLVVAEIEVNSIQEQFEKPAFLDREVTGDKRFYNSQLRKHPFREWKQELCMKT